MNSTRTPPAKATRQIHPPNPHPPPADPTRAQVYDADGTGYMERDEVLAGDDSNPSHLSTVNPKPSHLPPQTLTPTRHRANRVQVRTLVGDLGNALLKRLSNKMASLMFQMSDPDASQARARRAAPRATPRHAHHHATCRPPRLLTDARRARVPCPPADACWRRAGALQGARHRWRRPRLEARVHHVRAARRAEHVHGRCASPQATPHGRAGRARRALSRVVARPQQRTPHTSSRGPCCASHQPPCCGRLPR